MFEVNNDFNLQDELIKESVFTVGRVWSVTGRDIVVRVNKDKNLPHLLFRGKTIRNVSVGLSNYIKILKGFTEIICKVEGEYLEKDDRASQIKRGYANQKQKINRFLKVSVFGYYDSGRRFKHGIKEMPLIGSECRLLSRDEFNTLHQLSDGEELSIPLGPLVDEETQDICVPSGKLFAGHIGIFGTTGSGKSNTLAKMYTELFRSVEFTSLEDSRFIFIDFNGEYSAQEDSLVLTENKKVYTLRTQGKDGSRYPLNKTEMHKLEVLSILLDATEKTQQPFLHRAISTTWFDEDNCTKEIHAITENLKYILTSGSQEFNVPFIKKLVKDFTDIGFKVINDGRDLDDLIYHSANHAFYLENGGNKVYSDSSPDKFLGDEGYLHVSENDYDCKDAISKLQFKILNQYYYEVLRGHINQEHISPLIGRLKKRFDILQKVFQLCDDHEERVPNVRVINLKNVNLEMKKIVPLLVCKTSYDEQKSRRDVNQQNSLHIIVDEAHNILSEISSREAESWRDYRLETFEEIVKEGRKFGVFLTIASQRPSDISPTIISQLHNYFIHRLINDNDLRAISKAVSYLDKLSFDSIPNLSTGCCFIAGQMTQFPLSVRIELLHESERPQNETINLSKLWRGNPDIHNDQRPPAG